MQLFLKKYENYLARSFDFTLLYTNDMLLLHHSKLGEYVYHIYLIEIKDTTATDQFAFYPDLHLKIDSERR